MISKLCILYDSIFSQLSQAGSDWLMGLTARLVFSSVVLFFFLNSAMTKLGSGFPGILQPGIGAYAQILPSIAESAGYDLTQISFIPWGLVVYAGTYAEILIPLAILLGLFTRLSSLAMIGFIVVMSFVDVAFHGLDSKSIGLPFDRLADAIIFDQRLLWIFPLCYLAVHGGGKISVDFWLRKRFNA